MKKLFSILSLFSALNVCGQSDSINIRKTKIGIGISLFKSTAMWGRTVFNPNIIIAYKKHSISAGAVFSDKMYSFHFGSWFSGGRDYILAFNGLSFHYRFIVRNYQKRWSPIIGYNFNYVQFIDRKNNSDGTIWLNAKSMYYESILTLGLQWRVLKKFSILAEVGIGPLYYKDTYYNSNDTYYGRPAFPQERKEQMRSRMVKLSFNYLF